MSFRKRKAPENVRVRASILNEDTSIENKTGDTNIELADGLTNEPKITLDEILLLQKSRDRGKGLNSSQLIQKRVSNEVDETEDVGSNADSLSEPKLGGLNKKSPSNDKGLGSGVEPSQKAKTTILNLDTFTGQTNVLDANKNMMEYIQTMIEKNKKEKESGKDIGNNESLNETESIFAKQSTENKKVDNIDMLYIFPESTQSKKVTREGNVSISSAMLTSIPEVDLGLQLENIEETERAKRQMQSDKANDQKVNNPFLHFKNNSFFSITSRYTRLFYTHIN
ncbi:hypothetical protein AYI69_g6256 [Smittium culicis]|uniref:Uncharacterized protein n=1 Tax=Smittium culicis TaxID=133412 RepID=A0A1R1Y079_9FUNG|nr:hypothetical protein AYI69_g6256 [Smittium culicis]